MMTTTTTYVCLDGCPRSQTRSKCNTVLRSKKAVCLIDTFGSIDLFEIGLVGWLLAKSSVMEID